MLPLGNELAVLLLASGNWHAMARLESELNRLAETASLTLTLRRTDARGLREDHVPYSVDAIGPDHSGIIAGLTGFFLGRSIEIGEIASRGYVAQQTGAPMFSVQMMVNVPTRVHIAQLREDFMDYCDSQNLDAILEPVKS
jgi:glycine cleavage system transcriptional repressor